MKTNKLLLFKITMISFKFLQNVQESRHIPKFIFAHGNPGYIENQR